MQRAEYKKTSIRGLNVHYVDTGEAGDGPVVLLLHGLADSLLSWYCNIGFLADAGYRVIAPDLPGFGESDKPSHLEYDPGSAADFVYDFCQKLVLVDSEGVGRKVSWLLRSSLCPHWETSYFSPN